MQCMLHEQIHVLWVHCGENKQNQQKIATLRRNLVTNVILHQVRLPHDHSCWIEIWAFLLVRMGFKSDVNDIDSGLGEIAGIELKGGIFCTQREKGVSHSASYFE